VYQIVVIQSHAAGEGPQFVRMAFNVYGRSPLMSQYMASVNVANVCSGVRFLVQRTELENLPPYPFYTLLTSYCIFCAAVLYSRPHYG